MTPQDISKMAEALYPVQMVLKETYPPNGIDYNLNKRSIWIEGYTAALTSPASATKEEMSLEFRSVISPGLLGSDTSKKTWDMIFDACADYALSAGSRYPETFLPEPHTPVDTLRQWMAIGSNITKAAEEMGDVVNKFYLNIDDLKPLFEEYICTKMFKNYVSAESPLPTVEECIAKAHQLEEGGLDVVLTHASLKELIQYAQKPKNEIRTTYT